MVGSLFYVLGALIFSLAACADDSDSAARWDFLLPAVVLHGMVPGAETAQYMPRKLTSNGSWVETPGFGFEYEGKGSLDVLLAAFKDCYDHPAGTFQIGQFLKLGGDTRLGYTLGFYMRQAPMTCSTIASQTQRGRGQPMNTSTSTTCTELDNLPLRSLVKIDGGYADIIPLPFLNFSTALIKTKTIEIDFKFMSNYILNEFGLGIPF